jgi:hypothetical protein
MTFKRTYWFVSVLIFLSLHSGLAQVKTNEDFNLLTKKTEFTAGNTIALKFSNSENLKPQLYISYSHGSTIIKPSFESGILSYVFPNIVSNKIGLINWQLLSDKNPLSGICNVIPQTTVTNMETYLGPPSIAAGGTDFSMIVVIPTDIYDNPLQDSTAVNIKHHFSENQSHQTAYIKNGISYKYIYSETKTGRILVSSECHGKNSKEYTINVLPNTPTNFTLDFERYHNYADGNQITTFSTSVIKDTYGNMVSDGTYVQFYITNKSKAILKTSGTTISGIATAKMIHPSHEDLWNVKAFIEGMAESNVIELNYSPALSDYDIQLSENHRTIIVGPLKSFMNQVIPDGLEVSLSIYKNNINVETILKSSFEGYASFVLDTNNFPNGTYTFKIEAAGIVKTLANIKL